MTLIFPLAVEVFNDRLFLEDAQFQMQRSDETSGMGSLDPLHAQLASPLWRADCSTGPIENADAEGMAALFEVLERPGNDFYITNPRKPGPRLDPEGDILGNAVVTLADVFDNNHEVRFEGLPEGYILAPGDMFAFEYGPTLQRRRALHRIVETGVANASGVISRIEVGMHIRPGWAAGAVVTLINAAMRAKIVPGSYRSQAAGAEHQRFSFTALQKLI